MSRRFHPTLDAWVGLLAGETTPEQAASLRRHLDQCAACAADVRLVGELGALSAEPWGQLPRAQRMQARAMPRGLPTPPLPARRRTLRFAPPDVRSIAGVSASPRAGRALARSVPGADISVMVLPPTGEGLSHIRGRVWLRPPHPRPPRIVVAHDDHVLADVVADATGRFRMDEALAPGFHLEIHLPDGHVVELRDAAW